VTAGRTPAVGPVTVRVACLEDAAALAHLEGLSPSTQRALTRDLSRAAGPGTEVVVLVAERGPSHLAARTGADAGRPIGASEVAGADHLGARHDPPAGTASGDPAIVGAALGQVLVDEGHVLDLAVDPAHRGGGIGRTLLAALLHQLTERGAAAHTLEVRPTNLAALALYRAAGFAVEGRRPRYYPDGEDALLLWRRHEEGRT
jgi:[ribosomal protein S18]-alanine N-acetyltransferase